MERERRERQPAATSSPSHDAATNPAADPRARYDYTGGETERPDLVDALDSRIDGDVRFDEYTRQLYATDASVYEVTPVGVVFPTSTADVSAVLSYCHEHSIPALPRGAGTSLAGQAVNEAVVLDFTKHMDAIQAIDPETRTASVQPGLLLGDLNAVLAEHGLQFGPDPAWGDKSTIGGAIGNNSTGSHSLVYGKTDAYLESCEVVLADGTVAEFGDVSLSTLEHWAGLGEQGSDATTAPDAPATPDHRAAIASAVLDLVDASDRIEAAYPDIHRNVAGYNLDRLLDEAATDSVNLARLLAGSEGTLAIVTAATISLEPVPEAAAVALLHYETLTDAMADVTDILAQDPAAVEVLDDVLLERARASSEFGPLVDDLVPEGTAAALLVECYGDSDDEARAAIDTLCADRVGDSETDAAEDTSKQRATSVHVAYEDQAQSRVWKLRKSGLPLLLSRSSDAKHVSFVEDVAVDPADLPAFVEQFQTLLADHDTYASFYGHAGPGCLHVRPLVDTTSVEGTDRMRAIADGVADLVTEFGGTISGEHGDGRSRTPYTRQLYGQEIWELFRTLKTAFDPDWLLNPGQVCGYAADESRPESVPPRAAIGTVTDALRTGPDHDLDLGFEPALDWDNDNGMAGMVELCHGCGGCRGPQETTGGVMCPTYRAADEELTSTRGRANALRQAMSGDLPADPTDDTFTTEVMDLCLGCKGCARDCPSEVDMAKLKTELQYRRHQAGETTVRDRLFANVHRVSAWGSALAPLPRYLQAIPGSDRLAERLFGIARERDLPTFRRESLTDWLDGRASAVEPGETTQEVVIVPDPYTNYSTPAVGKAAVRAIEATGVHVTGAADVTTTGRAAFSQGFLDLARDRTRTTVDTLEAHIEAGRDIVVIEPSDAVMIQSDYQDLLADQAVDRVADRTYGVCEYLDVTDRHSEAFAGEGRLIYHSHCHQHATGRDHHAVSVLRRAGYTVDVLDSGCCGMAGSFGYEAEHYSMSVAIADILDEQIDDPAAVVAPGASCRTQLADVVTDERPPHPVEVLVDGV